MPASMLSKAQDLARRGFYLIPICWPDPAAPNRCACPRHHSGRDVGKAPLTPRGVNDSSKSIKQVWEWWDKWPQANIAVDLDRSGLIAIAPDAPEWHQTFIQRGLPVTYTIQSGGGPGHVHYYYRRPDGVPLINDNRPGAYDIQPRGYVIAEGSLHQSGLRYTRIDNFSWFEVKDLPWAPAWVVANIQARWNSREGATGLDWDEDLPAVPTITTQHLKTWWDGTSYVSLPGGGVDRSATLFRLGQLLAAQGSSGPEIVSALRDRDEALGYRKYSRRRDGGIKQYSAIARAVSHQYQPTWDDDAPPYDGDSTWPEESPWCTWINTCNLVHFRLWGPAARDYLYTKKEAFIQSLPEDTVDQRLRKSCITRCWEAYRKWRCRTTGERFLQRYRCGEALCPMCSYWLLEKFFTANVGDGGSKLDIMEGRMRQPSLFLVALGSYRFQADTAVSDLRANHRRVIAVAKKFKRQLGPHLGLAANHIRGDRVKIQGDVIHYQLIFGGEYESGAVEQLARFFAGEMGYAVQVREIVCHGASDLKRKFVDLMALRCDWDTPANYELWRLATKGSRLVQGVGAFYGVSGGRPARVPAAQRTPHGCPVCSACEPVEVFGYFPVASTQVQWVSRLWEGGQRYLVDVADLPRDEVA